MTSFFLPKERLYCLLYLGVLITATSAVSVSQKFLDVCYGLYNPDISLDCTFNGGVVVVDSALVGWSSQYDPGERKCPLTSGDCTRHVINIKDTCNNRESCVLDNSAISEFKVCNKDANFIHINYSCVPVSAYSPLDICDTETSSKGSIYIGNEGFPDDLPNVPRQCACRLTAGTDTSLIVNVVYLYLHGDSSTSDDPLPCHEKVELSGGRERLNAEFCPMPGATINEVATEVTDYVVINRTLPLIIRFSRGTNNDAARGKFIIDVTPWSGLQQVEIVCDTENFAVSTESSTTTTSTTRTSSTTSSTTTSTTTTTSSTSGSSTTSRKTTVRSTFPSTQSPTTVRSSVTMRPFTRTTPTTSLEVTTNTTAADETVPATADRSLLSDSQILIIALTLGASVLIAIGVVVAIALIVKRRRRQLKKAGAQKDRQEPAPKSADEYYDEIDEDGDKLYSSIGRSTVTVGDKRNTGFDNQEDFAY